MLLLAGLLLAQPQVSVCVHQKAMVRQDVMLWGEQTASLIFDRIGVRLHWTCAAPADVTMDITDGTPPERMKGALGYALPFAHAGVRAVVFYDRCDPMMDTDPVAGGRVLGHVMAHELGHVLIGVDGHADTGLMRAHWSVADLSDMRVFPLGFTDADAERIRRTAATARQTGVDDSSSGVGDAAGLRRD